VTRGSSDDVGNHPPPQSREGVRNDPPLCGLPVQLVREYPPDRMGATGADGPTEGVHGAHGVGEGGPGEAGEGPMEVPRGQTPGTGARRRGGGPGGRKDRTQGGLRVEGGGE